MAFITGYVTKEERQELENRGWEVESAEDYDLVGENRLMAGPEGDMEAVVIYVDSSVIDVMSGPDWEQ